MDGKRRTRFEGRVELEREFLTPVNVALGSIAPLAGMTRDAIESWKIRAKNCERHEWVDRVAEVLLEASTRAHLLADNSKDVFEPEYRPKPDSVGRLHAVLLEILSSRG
jgi:hypothetical protein